MESLIINNNTNIQACANNEIRLDVTSSLQLKNLKVALQYLGIYYSWQNFTAKNNNTQLSYIWVDGSINIVNIPDGFYSVSDLSEYMQYVMNQNGHFMYDSAMNPVYFINFVANPIYYTITVNLTPVHIPNGGSNPNNVPSNLLSFVPQIVIPDTPIQNNLGIHPNTYPSLSRTTTIYSFNSQVTPQISSITSILVSTNIISNQYNRYSDVLYQFAPAAGSSYASYLTREPYTPVYFNVTDGSYSRISLFFYDQLYNPITLLDRNIMATLIFQSK